MLPCPTITLMTNNNNNTTDTMATNTVDRCEQLLEHFIHVNNTASGGTRERNPSSSSLSESSSTTSDDVFATAAAHRRPPWCSAFTSRLSFLSPPLPLVRTECPNIVCTQLPRHWRTNKKLPHQFRVYVLSDPADVPDGTIVTLQAGNEESVHCQLKNDFAYVHHGVATFADLRFLTRSGRGKLFKLTIMVRAARPLVATYRNAIKVTVDGPREPRPKAKDQMKSKSCGQYRGGNNTTTAAHHHETSAVATLAAAAAAFPFFTQMLEQLSWPRSAASLGLAPARPTLASPDLLLGHHPRQVSPPSPPTLLPIIAPAPLPPPPPPPPASCFYEQMFRRSLDEIEAGGGAADHKKPRRTSNSPSHSSVSSSSSSSAGSDSGSDSQHSELRSPTLRFRDNQTSNNSTPRGGGNNDNNNDDNNIDNDNIDIGGGRPKWFDPYGVSRRNYHELFANIFALPSSAAAKTSTPLWRPY